MFRNPKENRVDNRAATGQAPQPASSPMAHPFDANVTTPKPAEALTSNVSTQTPATTPPNLRAMTDKDLLAREIKEGTLQGFVGNSTRLTGDTNFKGMLRIDGHVSGKVSSQDGTLIVSSSGTVEATIQVAVAQIFGTVNGDITAAERIEMGRVAKVTGNIQTPALVVEQGAVFEGTCRMTNKNSPKK